MADLPTIFELVSQPGIKRDGTNLDNAFYQEGQWVRFQRGRPRKIGGYQQLSGQLLGPVRGVYVDSRSTGNTAHTFSTQGVERVLFDNSGVVSDITDRTPSGFTANDSYTWQTASMFQSGGSGTPTLIGCVTPDMANIASDDTGYLYAGDVTAKTALAQVSDSNGPIQVSGGVCVLQPFVFVYGSNGLIRSSNPNDISTASGWTPGQGTVSNNVAATKIVKGLQMRGGGNSPAGLFWALDSLIRVSFVGSASGFWKYDVLSDDVTVLSKSAIVEYDNVYYWVGSDRFFMYDGIVRELPNEMNLNFFFDNLNASQAQKVWALKVPRWGEIWWFFPSGTNTECDTAVIYNVREKTWYDTKIGRSAGFPARVFQSPLMAGELVSTTKLTYTQSAGAFSVGEQIQGLTSGAVGTIAKNTGSQLNLVNVTGTFQSGETISDTMKNGTDQGTVSAAPSTQSLTSLWRHEYGTDRVVGTQVLAIDSYIVTNNFQWMTGGPIAEEGQGGNFQSRLTRVEPDFNMTGSMNLYVVGNAYAQAPTVTSSAYSFTASTEFVDLREQRREISLKFESNTAGGNWEMGKVLLTVEPGDERG
jgi:hypothetical protein